MLQRMLNEARIELMVTLYSREHMPNLLLATFREVVSVGSLVDVAHQVSIGPRTAFSRRIIWKFEYRLIPVMRRSKAGVENTQKMITIENIAFLHGGTRENYPWQPLILFDRVTIIYSGL